MSEITTNLGIVTAYGYALDKGYTGTEEQFATALAAAAEAGDCSQLICLAYSTSATYDVGEYVIYNGGLYRCTTEISTAESWTAAHWTQVTVGSELNQLMDAFDELQDAITKEVKSKNLIDPSKLITGRLKSDGSVDTMSGYATSDYILLEPGSYIFGREKLTDGTAQAMGYSGYGFYDLTKTWVANSRVWDQWTGSTTLAITIQSNVISV